MSKNHTFQKRILLPDPMYKSITVHMLINRVLKKGKKNLAAGIVYKTLQNLQEKTGNNPVDVLEQALENVTPKVEVKPKRKAGTIQMVPLVIRAGDRAKSIAIRWILEGCHKRTGQPMVQRLYNELLEAYKNTGYAVRKRDELHRMAVSNAMYSQNPQTVINSINLDNH